MTHPLWRAEGRAHAALAAATGPLLALAFPGHPHQPWSSLHQPGWAWIALVPLFVALRRPRPAAFRLGWISGSLAGLLALYWVGYTQGGGLAVVGGVGLLAAYLGLFTGSFAWGLGRLWCRWGDAALLAAVPLWVGQEYLLASGELGFPWLLLGHSQTAWPLLVQTASLTGVYGVSAWVVLTNVLVALLLVAEWRRTVRVRLGVGLLAAAVGPVLYGWWVIPATAPQPSVHVAVVQPNLSLAQTWGPGGLDTTLVRLTQLTRQAAAEARSPDLDLVVWPETALPCYLGLQPRCRQPVQALARELATPIFTGASGLDSRRGEPLNSAYLVGPEPGEPAHYAKMHLVPFGERTPFRDRLPFLRQVDWTAVTGDLGPAEFAPGLERTVFVLRKAPFVALICFEAVFPDFTRRSVLAGGRLLVNITNDSWFGPTAGPYQHARIAAMRAVENRTPMVRCASTGISCFFDAYGRQTGTTQLGVAATVSQRLTPGQGGSFYTRHGDWFAAASLAVAGLLLAATWRRGRSSEDA